MGALTSINEGNYCVKGMREPRVKSGKSYTATAKDLKEAICLHSAPMYLCCVLAGISKQEKRKSENEQFIVQALVSDGLEFAEQCITEHRTEK